MQSVSFKKSTKFKNPELKNVVFTFVAGYVTSQHADYSLAQFRTDVNKTCGNARELLRRRSMKGRVRVASVTSMLIGQWRNTC